MFGLTYTKLENSSQNNIPTESENKGDNVFQYWEKELFQFTVRPYLKNLLSNLNEPNKLRILELGNGENQGFEILSKIQLNDNPLNLQKNYLLNEGNLGLYLSLGTDYEAVEKSNELYRHKKQVRFIRTDYQKGLGVFKAEEAFHLYFATLDTLSHWAKPALLNLFKDIHQHANPNSLFILDYKLANASNPKNTAAKAHIEQLILDLKNKNGLEFDLCKLFDRSIFIDNTSRESPFSKIRLAVNHLFESFTRTDLSQLILKASDFKTLKPVQSLDFINNLIYNWNVFVQYAQTRLETNVSPQTFSNWEKLPSALQFSMLTLDRLIRDTQWIAYGDIRANIIEPHIAYALRSLEFELQQGLGCGQYLLAVLKIKK